MHRDSLTNSCPQTHVRRLVAMMSLVSANLFTCVRACSAFSFIIFVCSDRVRDLVCMYKSSMSTECFDGSFSSVIVHTSCSLRTQAVGHGVFGTDARMAQISSNSSRGCR